MLIAGLCAVFISLVALRLADDGMATCQVSHSFGECAYALR